jgi:DNA-dependent RNA polymerase auxiliary subunit epsilon
MPRTIGHPKRVKPSKKKQQTTFLNWLEQYASVTRAAKKAKVPRSNIYEWLKSDADFKSKFDDACELAVAALEDEAVRRAHEGTVRPVYQQGKKVGGVREFSDTLLIVLLKARAPEKYKERSQVDSKNTNFNVNSVELTDDEVRKYRKALEDDI